MLVPQVSSMSGQALAGCALASIATALMLLHDRHGPEYVGLSIGSGWWQQALLGLTLGGGSMILCATAMRVAGYVTFEPGSREPTAWLGTVATLLPAALAEELLFRGYGFQRLVEGMGRWLARGLLAFFFGWVHHDNPGATWTGVANTVLVGVVFGLAYLRTRQLWLPIAWHWSWNLTEATLGFPVSGLRLGHMPLRAVAMGPPFWTGASYGPEASLPVTLVLCASLVLVLRWKQVEDKCVTDSSSPPSLP